MTAQASSEHAITDFMQQCAELQTRIEELKQTSHDYDLAKLISGKATEPLPALTIALWAESQYRRPERWIIRRGMNICSEPVTHLWDCAYLFFNIHGELGGTCVLHTILRQITAHHTSQEFLDPDLNWVKLRDRTLYPDAAPDLPWNTEGADLGLVQRVLKNDKYCYLGLFYLQF